MRSKSPARSGPELCAQQSRNQLVPALRTEVAKLFHKENALANQGLIGWGTLTFRKVNLHIIS